VAEETETTNIPDWVDRLWSELRFKEIAGREGGLGYQRLFQQVMKAVERDDFLDIRAVGKHGDFKCDGWGMASHTCYAVYGPFSRKSRSAVQRKIVSDFNGAVAGWPEMQNWRIVHNDYGGLSAVVAAVLVSLQEEAKSIAPNVNILPPWGPGDLWWMFRQAPAADRVAILGSHGRPLTAVRLSEFADIGNDHVSVSAGQSVVQLMNGFASDGAVDPLNAAALSSTLAAFILGDDAVFEQRVSWLTRRCQDDPFEMMITSIIFCAKAIELWKEVTGASPRLLADGWIASGATIPYIADMVLAAHLGQTDGPPIPGHANDQQKLTMNLGQVTALTLEIAAYYQPYPLVSVLQDFLIRVQRQPANDDDLRSYGDRGIDK
jgi:hypothetical protein